MRFFRNDLEAVFVDRPNRFVIRAEAGGELLRCHCPNPGRMEELLAPGSRLILERRRQTPHRLPPEGRAPTPGRAAATEWTAVAVRYRNAFVPLYSARANDAAAALVIPRLFPDALMVEREATIGNSRFDFLVTDGSGRRHLLEVKACSLVEHGVALFPDAPSARATRHLDELAALADRGYRTHALFLILHGEARLFSPNPHTDPLFASALRKAAPKVDLRAFRLGCDAEGEARIADEEVPVDLSAGAAAEENRGSYCVVLTLDRPARIEVGSLGGMDFLPGKYVYCGSAQRNLAQRLARHLRKRGKALRWHLDYLTPFAARLDAYPIASSRNLECDLAAAFREAGGRPVPRFGSSDCRCASHLLRFDDDPVSARRILDVILEARHSWSLPLSHQAALRAGGAPSGGGDSEMTNPRISHGGS